MSDSMANWLSRPKLRRASEYLLAVASLGLAFVAAGLGGHPKSGHVRTGQNRPCESSRTVVVLLHLFRSLLASTAFLGKISCQDALGARRASWVDL